VAKVRVAVRGAPVVFASAEIVTGALTTPLDGDTDSQEASDVIDQ